MAVLLIYLYLSCVGVKYTTHSLLRGVGECCKEAIAIKSTVYMWSHPLISELTMVTKTAYSARNRAPTKAEEQFLYLFVL